MNNTETIVAQATATGRGGVGIVRISGSKALDVAKKILGKVPSPRIAELLNFHDENNTVIDEGIAIYFKAPHSFTGEHVLELQGHGGPIIMDMLLEAVLNCGVYMAKPGEFSERAFHNDKLDLAQAEAIADLIESGSRQAAKSALRSLNGEFSQQINLLLEKIIHLRIYSSFEFSKAINEFGQPNHTITFTSSISLWAIPRAPCPTSTDPLSLCSTTAGNTI